MPRDGADVPHRMFDAGEQRVEPFKMRTTATDTRVAGRRFIRPLKQSACQVLRPTAAGRRDDAAVEG